jgi:hypoxanthine-guanine phosphoribosyltransferase
LLHKKNPVNLQFNFYPDFIGFFIPLRFIIGYGLDNNEYNRDIKHLCTISQKGIEKYQIWNINEYYYYFSGYLI